MVEVVVGPVAFGLDYRAFEVEGRGLARGSPDGGSCQRVCHATGIVPPSSPFWIRDPFGGEGAAAGFCYGIVEGFEGCMDRVPPIIVIPGGDKRRCAMFGSVWQAWGQQHNELLHPRIFVFVFGTVASGSGWWDECRAVKGVDVDGYSGMVRSKGMIKGNIYLAQLGGQVCSVVGEDEVQNGHLLCAVWWCPGGDVSRVEAVEAVGLKPVGEGGGPTVGHAIGGGPEGGVRVEVPDQKGGDLVVEFV